MFSVLAWKISWTGEPGGLQSTGPRESDRTAVTQHRAAERSVFPVGAVLFGAGALTRWIPFYICHGSLSAVRRHFPRLSDFTSLDRL